MRRAAAALGRFALAALLATALPARAATRAPAAEEDVARAFAAARAKSALVLVDVWAPW